MHRAARTSAVVSGLLFLGFLWLSRLEVALRFPESYFLPDRTRDTGVFVGWCTVLVTCVTVGLARGHLSSRRWTRLSLVLLLSSVASIVRLVRLDARDYPRVNFAFVAGTGVDRLLVLLAVGLLLPGVLGAVALVVAARRSTRQERV